MSYSAARTNMLPRPPKNAWPAHVRLAWLLVTLLWCFVDAQSFNPTGPTGMRVCQSGTPANTANAYTIGLGASLVINNTIFVNCPPIIVLGTLTLNNVSFVGYAATNSSNSTQFPSMSTTSTATSTYPGGQLWIQGGTLTMNTVQFQNLNYLNAAVIKIDGTANVGGTNVTAVNTVQVGASIDARFFSSFMVIAGSSRVNLNGFIATGISRTSSGSGSGSNGALFTIDGSQLTLQGATVTQVSIVGSAAALHITNQATVVVSNSVFNNITASQSGPIAYMDSASSLVFNNVGISLCSGGSIGGIVITHSSTFQWNGGYCINSYGPWASCVYMDNTDGTTITWTSITGLYVAGATTNTGIIFLNTGARMTIDQSVFRDSIANTQATAIYSYDHVQLNITNTLFQNLTAGGSGGTMLVMEFSQIYCRNITVISSTANMGGFVDLIDSHLTIENSKFSQILGKFDGGVFYTEVQDAPGPQNIATLRNCTFINTSTGGNGGVAKINLGSVFTFDGCTFVNNTAALGGGAIRLYTVPPQGSLPASSTVSFANNNIFQNTISLGPGGAIYSTGMSTLQFLTGSTTQVNTASAATYGGFLEMDDNPTLVLNGSVTCRGTTASLGSVAYFQSSPSISFTSQGSLLGSGDVFFYNTTFAYGVSQALTSGSFVNSGNGGIAWKSPASTLVIDFSNSLLRPTLEVTQPIPPFNVKAVNSFGNPPDINLQQPVILAVTEILQNVTLQGETMKTILNATSHEVTFKDIVIPGLPGQYRIQISALTGVQAVAGSNAVLPTYDIYVKNCDPGQLWDSDSLKCLTVMVIDSSARIAFKVIAALFFAVALAVLAGLYKYRGIYIIKTTAPTFAILMVFGAMLAFCSVFVTDCLTSVWLENLGFMVLFPSLILKTYRIFVIFTTKRGKSSAASLTDAYLSRFLIVGLFAIIGYLVAWTLVSPPTPQVTKIYNFFTLDRCTDSIFTSVSLGIHLVLEAVAVFYAYSIRNVHSDFNEAKMIGFTCYNWALLGALLLLVSTFIPDPTVAFSIKSVSVLLPNLVTVLLLMGAKIYTCVKDPEEANKKPKTYATSSSGDDSHGSSVSNATVSQARPKLDRQPSEKTMEVKARGSPAPLQVALKKTSKENESKSTLPTDTQVNTPETPLPKYDNIEPQ
ncbi:7 transmembrane sweet-taste receptor of 3 GCPR-domain-containing protein [Polychytrium aggregatum]|uniref:7 transmembrane sweet-taste receptor of 3 GCPR-domain-containing protein n=1 Tax=Polychytrium aggregatum TaxID=110093 RepID=UPI0022FF34FB|nr:7 transmembrane sweet-taste receptor of 3 GCPR-domain-containing protein [Polychytrium aggregatum]KAI9203385.1 7 transmembrane sweet-taste receptor of 3 GCPR-domain-containing protein [Polychytrium aggregatum]